MTVGATLAAARGRVPAAEARLLLCHVLGCRTTELLMYPERPLATAPAERFAKLLARRTAGEPIAYLLGEREFYGRRFQVTPAVLIPRPETELLVDLGRQISLPRPRILDLGTGSGCVAISLALELPAAEVVAVDWSASALALAAANAAQLGAKVAFIESDWFAAVDGYFDLIVANPPYIAVDDPHLALGDLRFEPPLALACGTDGLDALRRIIAAAPAHLAPNGRLWLEHGYDQDSAVAELLHRHGYREITGHRDLAGIVRVSGGCC